MQATTRGGGRADLRAARLQWPVGLRACVRFQGQNFLVQTQGGVFLGRIGAEMQTMKLCNYLHFVFRQALAFPQIVCPGWKDNFYLEGVRAGQILLQMPAAGTVSNRALPARSKNSSRRCGSTWNVVVIESGPSSGSGSRLGLFENIVAGGVCSRLRSFVKSIDNR